MNFAPLVGPRNREPRAGARPSFPGAAILTNWESLVLDVVTVLGAIAIFALVGLIGKAVEKL